jgi:hypothetical protein
MRVSTRQSIAVSAIAVVASALAFAQTPELAVNRIEHHINPDIHANAPTAGSTGPVSPAITYRGGPVMGTPTVYIIWYGNWNQSNGTDTPAGQQIVRDFLFGLNNSPYYQINASYGTPTGAVSFGGETTDTGSQGTRLSDAKVKAVVSSAITSGRLPKNTSGVYFVLTSSNVSETSGFCSQYCGWHTAATISSSNIKYSFVGNAARCLSGCAAQTTSPNGNAGVDGMISVIAHELEEANTDPNPNTGWFNGSGENADLCAWTFGSHQQSVGGAFYNMTLPTATGGSRNYLVQRNLDVNSKCYIDYVQKWQ